MLSLETRRRPLDSMPWHRKVAEILAPVSPSTGPDDMEAWLLARIAEALEVDPLDIDPLLPPAAYGFEAAAANALIRDLERCLGRTLPGNLFDSGRSVRALAHVVCADTVARIHPAPPSREEMRRQVLARAARRPRRPLTDPGDGPGWGPAGCSPGDRTAAHAHDLALAS